MPWIPRCSHFRLGSRRLHQPSEIWVNRINEGDRFLNTESLPFAKKDEKPEKLFKKVVATPKPEGKLAKEDRQDDLT